MPDSGSAGARLRAVLRAALCAVLLLARDALAYDGPVGVTFAAPWIGREPGAEAVRLERLEVASDLRIDDAWGRDPRNARRAFPTGFVATVASTRIAMRIRNGAGAPARVTILLPFHASATEGTGFIRPSALGATIDGAGAAPPPSLLELGRSDNFALRGYLVRVDLGAGATRDVEVLATHGLALHPAWYHFEFRTGFAPPGMTGRYRPLLDGATALRFRLASSDPALAAERFRFRICRTGDPPCDAGAGSLADITARFSRARVPSGRLAAILVDRPK